METKSAWYTTEWWLTILSSFYMFLNTVGVLSQIPKGWAAIAWAVISALYAVGRGIAKNKGSVDPNLLSNYTLIPRARQAHPRNRP